MKIFGIILAFFTSSFSSNAQNEAQALPKAKYKVCGVELMLEEARSEPQRRKGLMFRSNIEENAGMLFVFEIEQELGFWMKNVPFNIDIGYFDSRGRLVKHYTMLGTSPLVKDSFLPNYPSLKPAKFAVEVKEGFFKEKNLKNCKLNPIPKT